MVSPWVSFVSVSPRIMALFTDKFTTKGVFSDSKCTSKGNKNKSITKSSIESAIFVGKTIGISLFATNNKCTVTDHDHVLRTAH